MSTTKNLYVQLGRSIGKSLLQAEIYNELLKGENDMFGFKKNKYSSTDWAEAMEDASKQLAGMDLDEKVEQIDKPEPAPKQEEWVWVKGYKGTDRDMCCKGLQYEIGGQRDYIGKDEDIALCWSGFHFCRELKDVFGYYCVGKGNRFFEVEALVRKRDVEPTSENVYNLNPNGGYGRISYTAQSLTGRDNKLTSKSIRFIRELTVEEVFAAFDEAADCHDWTIDMKKKVMETSLETVRTDIRCAELVDAGYSQVFAKYICNDYGRYKTAMAMASLDVSMDVKVMAIFLDN